MHYIPCGLGRRPSRNIIYNIIYNTRMHYIHYGIKYDENHVGVEGAEKILGYLTYIF
jgi:hypothetical protein